MYIWLFDEGRGRKENNELEIGHILEISCTRISLLKMWYAHVVRQRLEITGNHGHIPPWNLGAHVMEVMRRDATAATVT